MTHSLARPIAAISAIVTLAATGGLVAGHDAVRVAQVQRAAAAPIALHPDNPHYFLWQGRPTILITSAEHYGAVMNLDFDYRRYVDTLAADGMNYTRISAGPTSNPRAPSRLPAIPWRPRRAGSSSSSACARQVSQPGTRPSLVVLQD